MFILDLSVPDSNTNSNIIPRRTGLVPTNHCAPVNNDCRCLPNIDTFTPFESHDLLHRVPYHDLDPTLRDLLYPSRNLDPGFFHSIFLLPGPRDIDPGFNPTHPLFPRNPWEGQFPRPAGPSNEEMIKGLDRIDKLIDFIINSTEIDGVKPKKLDKAHKLIKERLKKLTRGLDLETKQRIMEELDEAFQAAKNGDLSKLEAFQEKLQKIRREYSNQPEYILCSGSRPDSCEMNSQPVRAIQLDQVA